MTLLRKFGGALLALILSGGLTADNVAEAISLTGPYAVDTASGTESAPGRKDPRKLRLFIEAAREAAKDLNAPSLDLRGVDPREEEPREARQLAGNARPFDWQFDE